ncbi:MAG: T9SS type A sorting domain-containing protein [Bacteroidales bacterium]|nr:T9SS type A sorting domain-containing protein [Bacteroidales bacterium]
MKSQLTPSLRIGFARKSIGNSINLFLLILLFTFNYITAFAQDSIYIDSSYFEHCIMIEDLSLGDETDGINPLSLPSDFLYQRKWIPELSKGILPKEFCYIPDKDKYYIYGDRKILVMNNQYQIISETYISDYSNAFPEERLTVPDHVSDRLAINSNTDYDELYCATDAGEFIVFNTNTDQAEFRLQYELPFTHLIQSKIRFNKENDHVYWILYGINKYSGQSESIFLEFDIINREIIYEKTADLGCGYIDILIHPDREVYYLSLLYTTAELSKIKIIDFNHQEINSIDVDLGEVGDNQFFIHHFDYIQSNFPNPWIYCLPHARSDFGYIVDAILINADDDFADPIIQDLNGYSVTCSYFDETNNRYYLGYSVMSSTINGVYVYNFSDDILNPVLITQDNQRPKPLNFCFNPIENIVYCVFDDGIHSYDPDKNITINTHFLYERLLDVHYDDSIVLALNYMGGNIEKFDPDDLTEDVNPIQIGSFAPNGVYCLNSNKVLLYNQYNYFHSFVCVYDENGGTFDYCRTPVPSLIKNVVYDQDHDVAYIAQNNRVEIFNCADNSFPYDEITGNNIIQIFYGKNQKLYILKKEFIPDNLKRYKILIYNTQDLSSVEFLNEITVCETGYSNIKGNFYYNDHLVDDEIYFSLYDLASENNGYFVAIDAINNSLIPDSQLEISHPSLMEYNSIDNIIYFKYPPDNPNDPNKVGVLYRENWQLTDPINVPESFYDFKYSDYLNLLYLACEDGKLRFIEGNSRAEPEIYLTDVPLSFYYDSENSIMNIYALSSDVTPYPMEEQFFIYDEINLHLLNVGFGNKERHLVSQLFYGIAIPEHDIIFNPDERIFYLSDAHSILNTINLDEGCYPYAYDNYEINDVVNWDDDKYILRNIIINEGGSLNINSTSTVYLKAGAKIIVKPGGELIINGGKLTKACEGYWWGIELQGQVNENQFVRSNQGYIKLYNQAVLEFSINGIYAGGKRFPVDHDDTKTGGIIEAENSTFINNLTAVEMRPYTNIHPGSGEPFINFSYFNDCEFIIDRDHPYQTDKLNEMIKITGIQGIAFSDCSFGLTDMVLNTNSLYHQLMLLDESKNISFRGCTFYNNVLDNLCYPEERGTGIYSNASTININAICTGYDPLGNCISWDSSQFMGFHYGVYAIGERGLHPVAIDKTQFINNLKGIYLNTIDNAKVTSSEFLMHTDYNAADLISELYGLYLNQCNAYHVEANEFYGLPEIDKTVGVNVNASGEEDNEIYSNIFENLDVGIESIGKNKGIETGLCLKCNDFEGNDHDMYIALGSETPPPTGISFYQGIPDPTADPTKPAGNTFSSQPSHQYDIFNECDTIVYVYHGENLTQKRIIPDIKEGPVGLHPNAFAYYSKELACPSKLGGGGSPETPKSAMALNEQKADSTQTELYALIDGGDTEELNTDVVMSFPDEALEVRQQLLDESPYLSDSVMKSAIYKEDVLPNAMIRDVLVANPQSAKSDEVLGALDYRWDPMPDYMLDEVMAGEDSIGNKEIMEGQIRGYRHLRELAFNELVGIYLKDTINSWAVDSLIVLLQNETSLRSKYMLVLYCLEKEDTAQMNSVLNTIPTTFILSPSQQQTYQNYLTYSSILMALQHDSVNNHYPDSTQLAGLHSIADTCNNLPSVYARNLLIHLGLISYNEPVYFPMALNSSIAEIAPFKDINFPKQSSISLFPNPAGNYFIIEYRIEKAYEKAIVSIHDINGKLVNMISLKGKMNQTIIPTGEMNNSIYIVSLHVDNELEDSSKLTLLK